MYWAQEAGSSSVHDACPEPLGVFPGDLGNDDGDDVVGLSVVRLGKTPMYAAMS